MKKRRAIWHARSCVFGRCFRVGELMLAPRDSRRRAKTKLGLSATTTHTLILSEALFFPYSKETRMLRSTHCYHYEAVGNRRTVRR